MTSIQLLAKTDDFGFELLRKEVAANAGQNVLVSPLSVSLCLGMVASGARSGTYKNMIKALFLPDYGDTATNNLGYANLINALKGEDLGVTLNIANAIYAANGGAFYQEFLDDAKTYFGAEVSTIDFTDPATLSVINGWVKEKTNKLIDKIADEIDPATMMMLLNAVYFKGTFKVPFEKDLTIDRTFTTPTGARPHPIMFKNDRIRHTEDDNVHVVALPFGKTKERRASLFILLPKPGVKVESVVNDLTANSFRAYAKDAWPVDVNLFLPKFEVEYENSLNETLKALGMGDAFSNSADFSGMSDPAKLPLKIDECKHKTFARVDEEGAEAAAVTSVGMIECTSFNPRLPVEVNVNRSFVMVIADEQTNSILFAGVINDPKKVQGK